MNQLKTRAAGQKLSGIERMDVIIEVKRLLIDGMWSASEIAKQINVDYKTATSYIQLANKLITGENVTVENTRKLQVQRIQRDIEKIEQDIIAIRGEVDGAKSRGEKPNRQELFAGIRAKTDLYERLHRITGLNTQINLDVGRAKRIIFVRAPGKALEKPTLDGELAEPI